MQSIYCTGFADEKDTIYEYSNARAGPGGQYERNIDTTILDAVEIKPYKTSRAPKTATQPSWAPNAVDALCTFEREIKRGRKQAFLRVGLASFLVVTRLTVIIMFNSYICISRMRARAEPNVSARFTHWFRASFTRKFCKTLRLAPSENRRVKPTAHVTRAGHRQTIQPNACDGERDIPNVNDSAKTLYPPGL